MQALLCRMRGNRWALDRKAYAVRSFEIKVTYLGGVLVVLGVGCLADECQLHRRMLRGIIGSTTAPVSFAMQAAWQGKLAVVEGYFRVRT